MTASAELLTIPGKQPAGIEEFKGEHVPPLAVVNIDPAVPPWHDENLGEVTGYNAGTPVRVRDKWCLPVRFEFAADERRSVIVWRRWDPEAIPEPDTREGHEGQYVIKLSTLDDSPPGESETWMPGQDPSVWTMSLRDEATGVTSDVLFMSFTEVYDKEVPMPQAPLPSTTMLEDEQRTTAESQTKTVLAWRTAIYAGSDPEHLERIFTSPEGQKDVFGIPLDDGSMLLCIRPQYNPETGDFAEAGPGKVAIMHLKSPRDLRDGLDFKNAKIISGFGNHQTWTGGKQGTHVGDTLVLLDGAHIAERFPLQEDVLVPGTTENSIRGYFAVQLVIDIVTGQISQERLLALPWEVRNGSKPKRPELTFIVFSSGEVNKQAQITPPPLPARMPAEATTQYIMSYGDSALRLVYVPKPNYDSPEVRQERMQAVAEMISDLARTEFSVSEAKV